LKRSPLQRRTPLRQVGRKRRREFLILDLARRATFARDMWTCQAHGHSLDGDCRGLLEAHHILPRSHGGQHHVDNLVSLCSEAHRWVHEHPARSYELGLLARTVTVSGPLHPECSEDMVPRLVNGAGALHQGQPGADAL
jgi:5-methylcytosine-specific restriction endonuclease McrA